MRAREKIKKVNKKNFPENGTKLSVIHLGVQFRFIYETDLYLETEIYWKLF